MFTFFKDPLKTKRKGRGEVAKLFIVNIVIRSAYHLNEIFGNSGANSNGTVHPGGKFSEKR